MQVDSGWVDVDGGGGATAESSVANVVLCTNRCKRNDGVLMKQEICGGAVDFCLFERNKKKEIKSRSCCELLVVVTVGGLLIE